MKKKLLVIALIIALAFSLFACGKKKDEGSAAPGGNNTEEAEEAEESQEAEESEKAEEGQEAEESGESEALTPIQEEFEAFVEEQYITSIEDSYLSMHIYYIDPEAAGIDRESVEVSFGDAGDSKSMQEDRDYYNSLYTALQGFNRDDLTRIQQDQYDSLEWEIKSVLAMADEKFDYYAQLFAVPNSLDADLVSYLSIWQLRNEQDVKDVITLIDSIPAYVDSCIEYAKEQQKRELFMTDFDQVIEGCDDVLNAGMESFIITRMLEEVDGVKELSADAKKTYKEELTAAFERSYLPSFEKIKTAMNEMKGGYNNKGSFFDFPHGKEYYQAHLNYILGTLDVSVDDFMAFSEERQASHMDELMGLYGKSAQKINEYYSNPPSTGYDSYDAILKDMESIMLKDFPEVKNLDYLIQPADKEEKLDEKNIAAYFVVPPVDGDNKQQMRVSPSNENVSSVESYVTVTHEGFPGHMYQYAFIADNIDSDYIKTLGVDGMVEGYAVYSQYRALTYLDNIDIAQRALARLNDQLGYLDYGYADMGIHYKGWGPTELMNYFNEAGYNMDEATATDIYEFLRFTPTYYIPYGLGYEFYATENERAEEALGDKFEMKEFNKAILLAGPTPRSVVSRYVDEYIESVK